jgi:hypothetical protein
MDDFIFLNKVKIKIKIRLTKKLFGIYRVLLTCKSKSSANISVIFNFQTNRHYF